MNKCPRCGKQTSVKKINKSRAVVDMVVSPITGETAAYTVPFSMLQLVSEAA